jgi:hypothetical protein
VRQHDGKRTHPGISTEEADARRHDGCWGWHGP